MAMNWNELARVGLSEISSERLERLFEIYDQIVGGTATYRLANNFPIDRHASQLGELRTLGILEWRFGSRISVNSKLSLRRDVLVDDPVVVVYFNPNVDEPEMSAAEPLIEAFNLAVI